MKLKTSLLGGVAVASVLLSGINSFADARTIKHHRVVKPVGKVDDAAVLRGEVNELRAQVDSLKAWRESQAAADAQSQAQLADVKAQLVQAQAQAQAAQTRVDAQIETIPGTVKTAVAAAVPKTDKLYYKGVTITPGGFLAMETVYRNHQEGADIGSTFGGLPLPNVATSHSGETRFTARQSRMSLLAQGDVSPAIHLAGYYEMDFLGAAQSANSNESNSYQPRIRNIYSTVDWDQGFGGVSLLAGQSWSLVTMNTKGIAPRMEQVPLTIEAQYVPGFNWARQPQIRLTANYNKELWFSLSAENPQTTTFSSGKFVAGVTAPITTIVGGAEFNSVNSISLNKYPDMIGKVAFDKEVDGHAVHVEAFGLLRDFYAQTNASGVPGGEDTAGGGFGGGAIVALVPKVLELQVSGLEGRGVGRYGSGQLPDVSFGVNGQIHPIREWALLAGGTFHPEPSIDVYAYAGEERASAQDYNSGTVFNGVGNPNYDNTGCETLGNAANCVGNTKFIDQVTGGFWHRAYSGKFGKLQWGLQYSYTERHTFAGYGVTPIAGGNPAPIARESMIFTSIRYYPF